MNRVADVEPRKFSSWGEINGDVSERGFNIDVDVDSKELIVTDSNESYVAVFNLDKICHWELCLALNDLFGFTLFLEESGHGGN